MSVTSVFWEHINFAGASSTSDSGPFRYFWNKYGSDKNDTFSSMRAWAAGNRGNVYAFEHINFDGDFAALNVGGRFSSAWWSYLGDDFNDKVSSSLIIARAPKNAETEVPLRAGVTSQFATIFDDKIQGKPVSRSGDPRMYATYFPSYDPDKAFATIEQALTVQVRIPLKTRITIWNPFGDDFVIEIDLGQVRWSDYKAQVRYDIFFFVSQDGKLHGQAQWSHVWVEAGPFSQKVHDELAPQLHGAKSDLTSAIESALALFARSRFSDAYLLPGSPPDMEQAGFKGRYDDDVTLVVVGA
jgi:hypothetical protein